MRRGERERERARRRLEVARRGEAVELVAAAATAAASDAFFPAASCAKYCFFGIQWRLVVAFGASVTALVTTLGRAGFGADFAARAMA